MGGGGGLGRGEVKVSVIGGCSLAEVRLSISNVTMRGFLGDLVL
jgi:hypothetical protein